MSTSDKTIRNFVVLLLAVVVGFGAYYFVYLQQHDRAIARNHLRLLFNAGSTTSDVLEGLLGSYSNAVKVDNADIFSEDSAKSRGTLKKTALVAATNLAIVAKLRLIPRLEERLDPSIGRDSIVRFLSRPSVVTQRARIRGTDSPLVRIGVALEAQANELKLVFASDREFSRRDTELPVAWQADLRELIEPVLPVGTFDGVILARSDGEVLFGTGDSPLRLQRLSLPSPSAKSELRDSMPGSQIFDARIAGESYRFFVQPVPLPIPVNAENSSGDRDWHLEKYWYIAAYLPTARYQFSTMAIAPTTVLNAVALIVLVLLSLPLLKTCYLGQRESLRQIDVLMLAISIIAGASLITFGLGFMAMIQRNASEDQNHLARLGADISRQLGDEIDRADSALVRVSHDRLRADRGALRDSILAPDSSIVGQRRHGSVMSREAIRIYPFLEALTWIDSTGRQRSKWSIQKSTTPLINTADRGYFQLARDGLAWPAADHDSLFDDGRVVESIRSKGTNQEFAIIARRFRTFTSDKAVAILETRLLSVFDTVLPPETGFAIVDRAGTVQFHSSPDRNLRERLFDELGSDGTLRSAVYSQQEAFCKTTYHTRQTLLHSSPVRGTPWSIVVFRDLNQEQSSSLQTLAVALGLYAVHIVVFIIVATVIFFAMKAKRRAGELRRLWYWPDEDERRRYAGLAGLFSLIGVLSILLVCFAGPTPTLWTSLLVALLGLALFHLGLRTRLGLWSARVFARATEMDGGDVRRTGLASHDVRVAYVGMMVALAALIGIIPALGYWRVAYDDGALVRLKAQQLEFADMLNARRLKKLDWYRDVFMRPLVMRALAANVRPPASEAHPGGFYQEPRWRWQYSDTAPACRIPCGPRFAERLAQELSIRGFSVPSLAAAGAITEPDPAVRWCCDRPDTMVLSLQTPIASGNLGISFAGRRDTTSYQWLSVGGAAPRLTVPGSASCWLLTALAMLILIGVVWTAIRYTFLERFLPPPMDGPASLEADKAVIRRAILLRFPLGPPLLEECHVIDMQHIRRSRGAGALLRRFRKSGCKRVLLREFHEGLREPETIRRKLELLEGLNTSNVQAIYIESTIEPLHFLHARLHDHVHEREKLGIAIDRWAAALEDYLRLRKPPAARGELAGEWLPTPLMEEQQAPILRYASSFELSRPSSDAPPREIVLTALDGLQAHYRWIWSTCSTEERLLLYRIAREGFVNRHARDILQPLWRRGLVVAEPNWRLVNDSFREFVLAAEQPDVIALWQSRGGESAWSRIKTPILLAIAVLGVFFFTTQRQALNQSLGLLAALTASVPGLINLFGSLSRLRSTSK